MSQASKERDRAKKAAQWALFRADQALKRSLYVEPPEIAEKRLRWLREKGFVDANGATVEGFPIPEPTLELDQVLQDWEQTLTEQKEVEILPIHGSVEYDEETELAQEATDAMRYRMASEIRRQWGDKPLNAP